MTRGVVAAGHEDTAKAALEILKEGGNAFDAAVGAGFAAGAAEPLLTSLGGGGFFLARTEDKEERLYDFFVQTPRRFLKPEDLDFHPIHADFGVATQEFHIGLGSVAVPGTVAGLFAVHRDLGRLPIQKILAPAIRLCREGVVVNPFHAYLFRMIDPIVRATAEARRLFESPGTPGQMVQEGDPLKLPEMADTLEALSKEGPDLFYRGELAHRLVEQCRNGGCLNLDDLASYRVERRRPLEFSYRGNRLLTNPPPSCGGILIAFALQLLERSEIPAADPQSPGDLIPLAWTMELTNKARADAMAKEADWSQAAAQFLDPEFLEIYRRDIASRASALRGTTHLNVVDAQGNVAGLSLSTGEGSGHILSGTGIMLNNMLGEEDLSPQGFHRIPQNQRMSSMMAPTLLFQRDGTVVALGSGGSNRIRTAIVQVLRHLIDHGLPLEAAVGFPRIHNERGLLSLEPGFPTETIEALAKNFPKLMLWEQKNLFFGGVHAVAFHPTQGLVGVGDPRRFGACLVSS